MKKFKSYHPIVNLIYFIFTIGFSCTFLHPVCLLTSLFCAIIVKEKSIGKNLLYLFPLIVFTALLNPLFNHQGKTVLLFLPGGNPLTLEAIIYGICAAIMLVCVVLWFMHLGNVLTSDKFIYLFGRIIPAMSLILSMTLRYVPLFFSRLKAVENAQRCIGNDISSGSIGQRIKNGLSVLSITVTWAFESSIDTADSMKARGYGLSKRTSFSLFSFEKKDGLSLFVILLLGFYVLLGSIKGVISFQYFPCIRIPPLTAYSLSVHTAYFILLMFPLILKACEVRKWKS